MAELVAPEPGAVRAPPARFRLLAPLAAAGDRFAGAHVAESSWLAAVAIVPILASVYQTLVLTDVTSDVIRLGIDADRYTMIWTDVAWGVAVLYGVFGGIAGMVRYGARDTLVVGLVWFALGNVLCGAAGDVTSLAVAKLVEGIGKGMVIVICRSTLYRQFGAAVAVAMVFYGVIAYATRPTTPLLTAMVNDAAGWRWVFWVNVPVALGGIPLVRRFLKPDRPQTPPPLKISWGAVTLFALWAVSLVLVFGWYRKWGGWTSQAFTALALFAILAPVALAIWLGGNSPMSEHLRRMFRIRKYVLAMITRMLLLVQLLAVITLIAEYCLELRDYPRDVTGWLLAAVSPPMALTTLLTFIYRPRKLRHVWLLVAVVGCAGCLWWMSSLDEYTSKQTIAGMMACWGAFVGLIPPVFLQDEVEGLDRRDFLYAGALAIVCLVVPLIVIPTTASTVISEWADRAGEAQRINLAPNRPEVDEAGLRIAEYYIERGQTPGEAQWLAAGVLGGGVKQQAVAHGIQSGLRFLSIVIGTVGLIVTVLLMQTDFAKPPPTATA